MAVTLKPPAPPYLAIAARERPDEPLGFVNREDATARWRYEFAPTDEGAEALSRLLNLIGRLGSGELPRATYDDGRPLIDADGALVLDGTVSENDPDPLAWLRSLAAFADALFAVSLVES